MSQADAITRKEADALRQRALRVSSKKNAIDLELAEILYLIWDTPVRGDSRLGATYTQWGYKSYAEYCDKELGMKRRRAEYYRHIGARFCCELDGAWDSDLIKKVPMSKLRLLAGLPVQLLTKRNVNSWLRRAQAMSCSQLEQYVQTLRTSPVPDGDEFDPETDDDKIAGLYQFTAMATAEEMKTFEDALQHARNQFPHKRKGALLAEVLRRYLEEHPVRKVV